ncbi:MAG: hypothetical protein AAFR59_19110 [Bacteroidota bacterium]
MKIKRYTWQIIGALMMSGIGLVPSTLFAQEEEASEIKRPLDQWVYEGSLDRQAHTLVSALNVFLWVAYDTVECHLLQTWRGGIKKDKSGVSKQMETVGLAYFQREDSDDDWFIVKAGKRLKPTKKFLGYEVRDQKLYINYELILPNGQKIFVEEYPEYTGRPSNTNRTGLVRTFTLKGVPSDLELYLHLSCPNMLRNGDLKTNSKFKNTKRTKKIYDWGTIRDVETDLLLHPSVPTVLTMMFTYDLEVEAKKRS